MENDWTKRIEDLTESRDHWKREWSLLNAGLNMAEEKIKELEAENTRLRMLRDAAESRAQGLEEENKYLRAGCQDDTRQCPIVGTNNTLVDKAKELEAENKRLREQYNSLIFEVSYKFPGESRHDTAKRYIREREEHGIEIVAKQALKEASHE